MVGCIYGDGNGYGYGDGDGDGDGYGDGDGNGDGYGDGDGYGYGDGDGNGDGDGYGYGYGDGDGNGDGDGDGYGDGDGDGYGNGDGYVLIDIETPIIAYHYVNRYLFLNRNHDGKSIEVYKGLVLLCNEDDIALCKYGLHASLSKDDARKHIGDQESKLTKVACSGRVILSKDKLVCSRREVLEIYV